MTEQIVIKELRPMSEAPDIGLDLMLYYEGIEAFIPVTRTAYNEFKCFATGVILRSRGILGWIPLPIYQPGEE